MPSSLDPLELADFVAGYAMAESAADPSLSRGIVGASWLLAESGEPRHLRTARELLARAASLHAARSFDAALFAGATGLQWTIDALSAILYGEEPDADVELDRVLGESLRADRWRGQHDLVSGLVGIGVYALANARPGQRDRLCGAILDQLEHSAIEMGPGQVAWVTDPALLVSPAREQFPRGCIDLGLAHGVPGVAAWLAGATMHRELEARLQQRAGRLLDAAIEWILSRGEAREHPHGFPYFAEPDGRAVVTPRVRLAWCYGDLGVAWALTRAACARGRADWAEAARMVGARAASRVVDDSGVSDPWLCHGGAGVAHLFDRLARETGDPIFTGAARRWWHRARELAQDHTLRSSPALLEGAAGLGLALLAAEQAAEPRWSAMFLV